MNGRKEEKENGLIVIFFFRSWCVWFFFLALRFVLKRPFPNANFQFSIVHVGGWVALKLIFDFSFLFFSAVHKSTKFLLYICVVCFSFVSFSFPSLSWPKSSWEWKNEKKRYKVRYENVKKMLIKVNSHSVAVDHQSRMENTRSLKFLQQQIVVGAATVAAAIHKNGLSSERRKK